MKKPQLLTIGFAVLLTAGIYLFGRTIPHKPEPVSTLHNDHEDHVVKSPLTIDSILVVAKKELSPEQQSAVTTLEAKLTQGAGKLTLEQQLHVYHQLARFWADTARIFEPYAWYRAEAARLENSEKNLTFAARLFLENLQADELEPRRQWKALQAKDLFERSLKINPGNDSAKVGIGATYLFGNISAAPMEGILKIREVVEKDSTNIYAQMMLVKGSLISGQYDKAITRLQTVNRMNPRDIEAVLLLAETYERMKEKSKAIEWYQKSIDLVTAAEIKSAIRERIEELKK